MPEFAHSDPYARNLEKRDERRGGTPQLSFPLLALIFVALMILLLNTGCTAMLPAVVTKENEPSSGSVLFSDDFSKTPSGWGTWTRDGAVITYHAGGLRIQVNQPQFDFWSVAGRKFSDARIEVDAAKIGGVDDNDFGILCRYRNKENFYMLVISSDGYYGIAKIKDGRYSMIGTDQLQYSSVIAQGNASNHLRADCVGDSLSLYANGEKLMTANDTDFRSGDVGVLAGAYDVMGVDMLFDNFKVLKP